MANTVVMAKEWVYIESNIFFKIDNVTYGPKLRILLQKCVWYSCKGIEPNLKRSKLSVLSKNE